MNNPYLTVMPWDMERIKMDLAHALPGQTVYIQNGRTIYDVMESGVTRRGVEWRNIHLVHRENATYFIRERALPWLVGKGIDVGCGLEKVTPDCIGTDSNHDYGERSDADVVSDSCKLDFNDGEFDWLYSSNNLEHLTDWETALSEWVRVVRPGGVIFLYLPWADKCPVHKANSITNPSHLWDFSPSIIRDALFERGVDVIDCDYDTDIWGTFVVVGRKR